MRLGQHQKQKISFPVKCPYRIIADDEPNVGSALKASLRELGITNPLTKGNQSSRGKYVSYQIDITLLSREMMQTLDQKLRSIEGVKMVL
jgi:putative lipoic acid-binding regulatory protein